MCVKQQMEDEGLVLIAGRTFETDNVNCDVADDDVDEPWAAIVMRPNGQLRGLYGVHPVGSVAFYSHTNRPVSLVIDGGVKRWEPVAWTDVQACWQDLVSTAKSKDLFQLWKMVSEARDCRADNLMCRRLLARPLKALVVTDTIGRRLCGWCQNGINQWRKKTGCFHDPTLAELGKIDHKAAKEIGRKIARLRARKIVA